MMPNSVLIKAKVDTGVRCTMQPRIQQAFSRRATNDHWTLMILRTKREFLRSDLAWYILERAKEVADGQSK